MMQPRLHKSTFSVDGFHPNKHSGERYLENEKERGRRKAMLLVVSSISSR
jgi:hypothetical protein